MTRARRRPAAPPPPPVEPRAKVLRARVALTLQGPTGEPVEVEREVPPDALELVSQHMSGDAATVDELATCEQTLAQVRMLAPTLGLPELATILDTVISVLRRVPGVSAELDRRGGRFTLR